MYCMLHYNYSFKYGCLLAVTRSDYIRLFYQSNIWKKKKNESSIHVYVRVSLRGRLVNGVYNNNNSFSLIWVRHSKRYTHETLQKGKQTSKSVLGELLQYRGIMRELWISGSHTNVTTNKNNCNSIPFNTYTTTTETRYDQLTLDLALFTV